MSIRKCIIVFCTLIVFSGCNSTQNNLITKQALTDKIKTGMNKSQVLQVAGEPDIKDDWGKGKFIFYYRPNNNVKKQVDRTTALPVFFKDNKVFAVGWKMKKELDRQNQTVKQSALLKKREKTLYEKVKKIPASDVKTNYELYKQLFEINPEKTLYIKKKNFYKAQFEKQKKEEMDLFQKAKQIPASDYKANFEIYEELIRLNPDNALYRKKRVYYNNKLNQAEKPSYQSATQVQSCYIIGYRFGRCSANTKKGLPCDERNKITIPDRCKNQKDTKEGIIAGKSSVN